MTTSEQTIRQVVTQAKEQDIAEAIAQAVQISKEIREKEAQKEEKVQSIIKDARVEIEPGVYSMPALPKRYKSDADWSDITVYKLRELDSDQIERYGLEKYVAENDEVNDRD